MNCDWKFRGIIDLMKSEIASDRIFTIQSAESCFRLVYSANKLKSELTESELDKVE